MITYPINPVQVTQKFGERPEVYKQFGLAGHNGIDYRTKFPDSPSGERSILSSGISEFFKKGDEGTGGYGKYLEAIYRLKRTWKVTYAHCKSIRPFTGATAGAEMAISDNTGFSTAAHLHMTTKPGMLLNGKWTSEFPNNGYKGAVDPKEFYAELAIMDDMPQWLRTMFLELGIDLNKPEGEIRFRVQEVIDGSKKFKELEVRIEDLKNKWEGAEGSLKEAEVKAKNDLDTIATLKIKVEDLEKSIVNRDAEMQKLRDRVEVLEKQMDPERVVLVTKDEYIRLVASDGLRGATWSQRLLSLFGVFPSK